MTDIRSSRKSSQARHFRSAGRSIRRNGQGTGTTLPHRPCTWTWRFTRLQILNAILSVVKVIFGEQKLCTVGRKKRLEAMLHGRNQGVLYLDGPQFTHCNDHFALKLKKNVLIP